MTPAIGDKITLTIVDIAFGGEGVARVEDFVVFVPFVLVGETVEVSMTNWGGTIVVVTGQFRRTRSTMITYMEPLDEYHCIQNVLVFAQRSRLGRVADCWRLGLRRLFTRGFMADEFNTLAGIRYNPAGLLECDRPMIDFYLWLAKLPQGPAPARNQATIHVGCPEPQTLCPGSES